MKNRFQILLAEQGQQPLKFTCPAGTSTCPATLLNKGEIQCKDFAQNITCRVGLVKGLVLLTIFCRIHLQLATGQVVMLHADPERQLGMKGV